MGGSPVMPRLGSHTCYSSWKHSAWRHRFLPLHLRTDNVGCWYSLRGTCCHLISSSCFFLFLLSRSKRKKKEVLLSDGLLFFFFPLGYSWYILTSTFQTFLFLWIHSFLYFRYLLTMDMWGPLGPSVYETPTGGSAASSCLTGCLLCRPHQSRETAHRTTQWKGLQGDRNVCALFIVSLWGRKAVSQLCLGVGLE